MKKVYKEIQQENGTLKIYGSNRTIQTYYKRPEWSQDEEIAFKYRGKEYFLSEFVNVHNKVYSPNPPEWLKEFDGYMNDSFFSGVCIKLINDENDEAVKVKAFTFVS